jgi:hypothetical protein
VVYRRKGMDGKRRFAAVIVIAALALTSFYCVSADTGASGVTQAATAEDTGTQGAVTGDGGAPAGAEEDASGSGVGSPDDSGSPGAVSGAEASEDPAAPATDSGIGRAGAGRGTAPAGIFPAVSTEYFIDIEQHIGEHAVAGTVTAATSSAVAQATFEGGRILGHAQGVADVEIAFAGGDTALYHVSVYRKYPQPKTAVILTAGDGTHLSKWARNGNTDAAAAEERRPTGSAVTITGQSGAFWRIGASKYIKKSDVSRSSSAGSAGRRTRAARRTTGTTRTHQRASSTCRATSRLRMQGSLYEAATGI